MIVVRVVQAENEGETAVVVTLRDDEGGVRQELRIEELTESWGLWIASEAHSRD